MSDTQLKTWFITGATRGLGQQIANAALAAGDNIVVTGRNLNTLLNTYPQHERLLALQLDVCNPQQAEQSIKTAFEHFGSLDVLVNNAGYGQLGLFEEIAAHHIPPQFDTNLFGLMAVTRAALPYMRQQRRGQIYNISSIGGALGFEAASVYCATKFAVEGFSESLAPEVKQFGISVTIVQPGFFRTDFLDNSSVRYGDLQLADYQAYSEQVNGFYKQHNHQQAGDPAKLAQALVKLSALEQRPLRFAAGSDALQYIGNAYQARLQELQQWAELSASTDINS